MILLQIFSLVEINKTVVVVVEGHLVVAVLVVFLTIVASGCLGIADLLRYLVLLFVLIILIIDVFALTSLLIVIFVFMTIPLSIFYFLFILTTIIIDVLLIIIIDVLFIKMTIIQE